MQQDVESEAGPGRPPIWLALLCLIPGALYFHAEAPLLPSLVLFLNLWVLSVYDWMSYRLPNLLTLSLFLTGLLFALVSHVGRLEVYFIGAVVGGLFFPTLNLFYKGVRGRDGVGLGDAKLLAAIGMWLGWPALPIVLLVASLAGLLYALVGVGLKRGVSMTSRIPFGPFLCLGGWVAWLLF
ncbi:MAG: prepilin peptidase [Alphaproteobacteria bacterium]|nr:prepilin peptidase [Alphaproteobacteria bacterium]